MNSFGLGLVLNFTDNATAGINNATRAFQQMSATVDSVSSSVGNSITDMVTASYALDSVGSTFLSAGSSIIELYSSVSQSVIDTGNTMQGFRSQLKALYGEDSYEQNIQEIKKYAAESVFEVEGLMSAITVMKSVGIEAMDEVSTSTGNTTQKLLDYASDIAAMVPNMRNSYGTGINAAMGAIKEYVAEGNAISLKRGAGFDIEEILGESKGSSIEERTRQVADLVEKLGIAGYTASLAGTPTQQLAKIQDTLFNIMSDIADSGVYEKYTQLLTKVASWIESLTSDTGKYNTIVSVLSDTITAVISPLESMLDFIIENSNKIIDWVENHKELTKNILVTVAAIGAFLVVGGAFLKFISAIGMASAGLEFLKKLPTVLSIAGKSFGTLILKAAPFVALAGLAYYAWEENLFGIRDNVTKVARDLGSIFSLIGDAWGDNTLSEENFQKAKDLGILPFIEGLLQLKYYWDFFVEGFKKGFKSFFEGLEDTFGVLGIDIKDIANSFGEFVKGLTEVGAEDKWTAIGENLGKIAGALVTIVAFIWPLMKIITVVSGIAKAFNGVVTTVKFVAGLFDKVLFSPVLKVGGKVLGFFKDFGAAISLVGEGNSIFSVLGAWFPKTAGVVSKVIGVVSKIGGVFAKIGSVVGSVVTAIAGALNIPVAAVVGIIAAVVALGVIIAKNWDKVKEILGKVGSWIYNNIIIPVRNFFATVINFVVGLVSEAWSWISGILSSVGTWIYNNLILPVVGFFQSLWSDITGLWSTFSTWVSENIIDPVVKFFRRLWNKVSEIFVSLYNKIGDVLRPIGNWVNDNVIQPVVGFFTGLWTDITDIFNGIYDAITGAFQDAWDFVTGLWSGITDFFGGIWSSITGWADDIIDKGESITGIESTISGTSESTVPAYPTDGKSKGLVPEAANGVKNFVGGLIQVNEKGGELITLPSGSTVVPHDQSLRDSLEKGINIGANSLAMYASKQQPASQSTEVKNDYSVTFSAGSIVIQLANATEAELEKAADKLMKIIERKQQLKAMAVRA